jgi:hypothetical protein
LKGEVFMDNKKTGGGEYKGEFKEYPSKEKVGFYGEPEKLSEEIRALVESRTDSDAAAIAVLTQAIFTINAGATGTVLLKMLGR